MHVHAPKYYDVDISQWMDLRCRCLSMYTYIYIPIDHYCLKKKMRS